MDPNDFLPELSATAERYKDRVQRKIQHCITCQPYEGGDYVWIFGEEIELEHLFEDIGVPIKHRDAIAEHLHCPGCGSQGFERWAPVGLEDRHEAARDRYIGRAESKYGDKLTALVDHLTSYPSLGLSDSIGRKIRKEIRDGAIETAEIEGKWVRARVVTGHQVFTHEEMSAPPIGRSLGGRYHHPGQSVLYIAQDERTAISEVLDDNLDSALVWVQEYQITAIANLLDLRTFWHRLDTSTSEVVVALLNSRVLEQMNSDRQSTWHPEYHITRLVADCAREAGHAGVLYSSTRGYSDNAVLFTPDEHSCVPLSRPRILMYHREEHEPDIDF